MSPPSHVRAARRLRQAQRIQARLAQWRLSLAQASASMVARVSWPRHLRPPWQQLLPYLQMVLPHLQAAVPTILALVGLFSLLVLSACGTAPLPAPLCPPVPAALLTPPRPPVLLTPAPASETPGTTRPPTQQRAAATAPSSPH